MFNSRQIRHPRCTLKAALRIDDLINAVHVCMRRLSSPANKAMRLKTMPRWLYYWRQLEHQSPTATDDD